MKNKRRFKKMLLVCLALVLVSALGGCGTPMPEDVEERVVTVEKTLPPFECTPLVPDPQDPLPFDPRPYEWSKSALYLENLSMVIGKREDVDQVMLMASGFLEEIDKVTLPYDDQTITIVLVDSCPTQNDDCPSVWEVPGKIAGLGVSDYLVYVEPVYLIGLPWDVAESPAMGPVPITFDYEPLQEDLDLAFWIHWAFDNNAWGIGMGNGSGRGSGAKVLIADASPFSSPGAYSFPFGDKNGDRPDLHLCVSHPVALTESSGEVNNHGLAVSSLVHAVAPESEIHLIRVLNNDGRGNSFSLLKAISLFLQRELDNIGTLGNVVINLSLGLPSVGLIKDNIGSDPRLDGSKIEEIEEHIQGYLQSLQDLFGYQPCSEDETIPFPALWFLADWAAKQGAVVVAAAGNDSSPNDKMSARKPACWDHVIGVGASTKNDPPTPASYSNVGDVYAPGGDEIFEGKWEDEVRCCLDPSYSTICDEESSIYGVTNRLATCKYALIVLKTPSNFESNTITPEYAYWAGTSFAAPLVSGQVALLLEQGVPSGEINATISNTAQGTAIPIINISCSLGQECPP